MYTFSEKCAVFVLKPFFLSNHVTWTAVKNIYNMFIISITCLHYAILLPFEDIGFSFLVITAIKIEHSGFLMPHLDLYTGNNFHLV